VLGLIKVASEAGTATTALTTAAATIFSAAADISFRGIRTDRVSVAVAVVNIVIVVVDVVVVVVVVVSYYQVVVVVVVLLVSVKLLRDSSQSRLSGLRISGKNPVTVVAILLLPVVGGLGIQPGSAAGSVGASGFGSVHAAESSAGGGEKEKTK